MLSIMNKSKKITPVTIVIVSYNSSSVINTCLKSIPEEIPVILVDNASKDNCCEVASSSRKNIKIIKNTENKGFGVANNIALEMVKTKFAFVLNPDTVLQKDTIDKLLDAAEQYPDAAIIAPTLHFENGQYQPTYKNSVFERENQTTKFMVPEGDLSAHCLSGAAMLLRMKCFKDIGFFDPEIFLFYEDDDICLKMRKNGYDLVLTNRAQAVHLMGKSTPPSSKVIYLKNWHMMWSRLYLEMKYKSKSSALDLCIKQLYFNAFKASFYVLLFKLPKIMKYFSRVMACIAFLMGKKADFRI